MYFEMKAGPSWQIPRKFTTSLELVLQYMAAGENVSGT